MPQKQLLKVFCKVHNELQDWDECLAQFMHNRGKALAPACSADIPHPTTAVIHCYGSMIALLVPLLLFQT